MTDPKFEIERYRKAASRGMKNEEQDYLSSIEKRIKVLEDYNALATRPAIRELIDWCLREIKSINEKLSTDRELLKDGQEAERFAMLERKDVLMYFISLFVTEKQLQALAEEISQRAQEMEEYQQGR